jgi:hypothetical protein
MGCRRYWAVFQSAPVGRQRSPALRGRAPSCSAAAATILIIDSSNYGEFDTLETNAVTVDSAGLTGRLREDAGAVE